MSKEWLTCAPTRTQTIRLTTHVAKTIANIVAGTVVLNKVVLRAAHAFEYHWWTGVKRKRKIIKEWRKGERWKRKKGEMFQRFCRLWGKCFSKGGFIALHVITKFLLVLLLIEWLFFPVWCFLWPTVITRMTQTHFSIELCSSLLTIYIIPTQHQQYWHQLFYSFSEQSRREEAFPTSPIITDFSVFLPIQTTSSD